MYFYNRRIAFPKTRKNYSIIKSTEGYNRVNADTTLKFPRLCPPSSH